jgi:hypothetical protein
MGFVRALSQAQQMMAVEEQTLSDIAIAKTAKKRHRSR